MCSVMWWRYWQSIGLAICRSRVRFLAGHHCVVALGKPLTPVYLSPSTTVWYQPRGDLFVWKSNHRPGGK